MCIGLCHIVGFEQNRLTPHNRNGVTHRFAHAWRSTIRRRNCFMLALVGEECRI